MGSDGWEARHGTKASSFINLTRSFMLGSLLKTEPPLFSLNNSLYISLSMTFIKEQSLCVSFKEEVVIFCFILSSSYNSIVFNSQPYLCLHTV